jgi:acetolactate synthase-1/2/3 large subunit
MDLNRRAALGILGTLGTAALAATTPTPAQADHVKVGYTTHRRGVKGRMTGAQAIVAALYCEGTRCVFGVPGAQNNELWDAMKSAGLPYLLVANEFSASIMADGAARATGEVGVFAVVPGPGVTNALTGIGEALFDSVPIVGIVTDIDRRPTMPIGQVHGLNNADILVPISKGVFEVGHVADLPMVIHKAFQLAKTGEPGPVVVVVPYNQYVESYDYDIAPPEPAPLPFDESTYQKALGLMADRRKKVGIYAGMGCADATPSLIAVAEMLSAPVATSVSGKGAIPDGHPLACGWGYGTYGTRTAEKAFEDVDIVLAVGVRYSEVSTAGYAVPAIKTAIHVDINPENLGRNIAADVPVNADSRLFLERMLADRPALQRPVDHKLIRSIKCWRDQDFTANAKIWVKDVVDPMFFLVQLRQAMCPNDLIVVDVTASTHWASEAIDVPGPRRYFTPADNQSMGWAIPAAIGAQVVRPDVRVACVTGDGCFLMSGLEASTAARVGVPVKFFILDDGAYHYMQMLQEPTFRRTTATELVRLDFAALAAGLRLGYNEISSNLDVPAGIARALAMPGPVLTRICIDYGDRPMRWLSTIRRQYVRHLSGEQQIRFASRLAVRALSPNRVDD